MTTTEAKHELKEPTLGCFNLIAAIIAGLLSGLLVHYVSKWLGLAVTLPGALWACAVTTVIFSRIHWKA